MGALRLFGLVLGASAWLIQLSYALYTHSRHGLTALVNLGMPAALFGALAAGVAVCVGAWLALRRRPISPEPKGRGDRTPISFTSAPR